jgi:hypothetical protein
MLPVPYAAAATGGTHRDPVVIEEYLARPTSMGRPVPPLIQIIIIRGG